MLLGATYQDAHAAWLVQANRSRQVAERGGRVTMTGTGLRRDGLEAQLQYVAEHCADTPGLRIQLEDMLRSHHQPGGFLASRAEPPPTLDKPIDEQPGTVIGPYKLLQEIGHGGMGVVYMAEQTEPVERRVALKIIKPGTRSTSQELSIPTKR
jgi:hypothetical protein